MRLSPLDPELYRMQAGLAAAHLFAGRFDAASSWAEKAFRELPSFLMVVSVIAASHALAGRPDEAQRAMKHLRELAMAAICAKGTAGVGRVEMWRGDVRLSMSVPAPFVWRCLSGSAVAPFPHPAHRTGHADFPHPALGQDFHAVFRVRRHRQLLNIMWS
jgi:hypothetical protein